MTITIEEIRKCQKLLDRPIPETVTVHISLAAAKSLGLTDEQIKEIQSRDPN